MNKILLNCVCASVTIIRTTIKVSKRKHLKFNMLLDYCIGKAAAKVREFYILPVGEKLIQYDTIAVNTIVKNKDAMYSAI